MHNKFKNLNYPCKQGTFWISTLTICFGCLMFWRFTKLCDPCCKSLAVTEPIALCLFLVFIPRPPKEICFQQLWIKDKEINTGAYCFGRPAFWSGAFTFMCLLAMCVEMKGCLLDFYRSIFFSVDDRETTQYIQQWFS